MKKMLCTLLALLLVCGGAMAETVFVTISDGQGNVAMAHAPIETSDADGDGAVTVYDALYAAHEAAYAGGAEAGFAAGDLGYGLSLTKLWGEENGGSYGYYVNNASAYGLTDPVSDGDALRAFVYTDLEAWSDLYCYFDDETAACAVVEGVALSLSVQSYDADWNPVVAPMAGATVTVDGADTQLVTDAEGNAQLSFDAPGEYLVSARSDDAVLVPPVCVVTVSEAK